MMSTESAYPRFSIVVNNYNYGNFIEEAIDSALRQMEPPDELVVVDDGSTDGSQDILHRYQLTHGIKLIEQKNQGQLRAVRRGFAAATGDVIVMLDSDDSFLDGYLARLRRIYRDDTDISFVFTEPEVRGTERAGVRETRRILDHMAFPVGCVGQTKWAAMLFGEFVGVPTSGISLGKSLADRIMSLPDSIDDTVEISSLKRHILGISAHEASKFGFAADAIIVRCASALGADKFYNSQPGFVYRIHGSNKYASVPRWGRWYMRSIGKRSIARLVSHHFCIPIPPTAVELEREFQQRSLPLRWRRRLRIRLNYCLALLTSRGSARQRLAALGTIAGLLGSDTVQT